MTPLGRDTREGARRIRERALGWAVVLGACSLFLPVELWARWYCRERGDALERTSLLLRVDGALGWRQRSNFSGTFLGKTVHTNELGLRAPDLSSITGGVALVLGPSSTFGWGVADEDTYSAVLARRLSQRPNAPAVVNAGQIGYSTFQGVRLARLPELAKLRWNAVILAYGVNDVDHVRFYDASGRPDREALGAGRNPWAVAAENGLTDLHFLDLGRRWIQRRAFARRCAPPSVPSVRVGAEEFDHNLETLVGEGRRHGAEIVVMSTPFWYRAKPTAAPLAEEKAARALDEARGAMSSGNAESAAERARKAIELDPGADESWYTLSASESRLGQCAESRDAFARARAVEPFRLHEDLNRYNEIARRAADRLGASFVDAAEILAADPGLLLDPIHPSARGHAMIGDALAEALLRKSAMR